MTEENQSESAEITVTTTDSIPVETPLVPVPTDKHYHGLLPRLLSLIEKDYENVKAWIEQEEAKL